MAAGFQSLVDHFGVATADLVLQDSNTTPLPISIEYAEDEEGNMAGSGSYDGGPAVAVECTYKLISNTLNLNTLSLGYLLNGATNLCVVSINGDTSNSDWPIIKLAGFKNVTNFTDMPVFTLPSITISGKKLAQGIDFTVGATCKLTSSTFTASGTFSHALDASGSVAAMAFSGAVISMGGTGVEISAAVSWTPGGTWTVTQAPNEAGGNISWGVASFAAEKYLTKDT